MKNYFLMVSMLFVVSCYAQEAEQFTAKRFTISELPISLYGNNQQEIFTYRYLSTAQNGPYAFKGTLPEIDFSYKNTYYQRNSSTGYYERFAFLGGEIRKEQTLLTLLEVPRNCPGPEWDGNAGSGDLVGALLRALVSDMDLKFKIGKVKVTIQE